MKLVLAASFFALTALSAFAQGGGPIQTVKIYSEYPRHEESYEGSGLIFKSGATAYVVTSDHVIFHSNASGFTHRIYTKAFGEKSAKYLVSDWSKGLALLEIVGPAPAGVGALPEESREGVGTEVEASGYPFSSQSLVRDGGGRISTLDSRIASYFALPAMIGIEGVHGEYGMSGGPVFDSASRLVGLLSNQSIGSDQANQAVNHLALIPGSFVVDWVRSYVSDPQAFKALLVQSAYSQRHGWLMLINGDLSLYLSCFYSNDGEEQDRQQGMNSCAMEISRVDPAKSPKTDAIPELEKYRRYLEEHPQYEKIWIRAFRKSWPNEFARVVYVRSYWEFFERLKEAEQGKLLAVGPSPEKTEDMSDILQALRQRRHYHWYEQPILAPLLDSVEAALETGRFWIMKPSDLDRAFTPGSAALEEEWKQLGYGSEDLKQKLIKLKKILEVSVLP